MLAVDYAGSYAVGRRIGTRCGERRLIRDTCDAGYGGSKSACATQTTDAR
jgi:hypothetical protein